MFKFECWKPSIKYSTKAKFLPGLPVLHAHCRTHEKRQLSLSWGVFVRGNYKFFPDVQIFTEINAFTHCVNLHIFPQKLLKFYIFFSISTRKKEKIISIEIYPFLFLTNIVTIYMFLICEIFGPHNLVVWNFDKYQTDKRIKKSKVKTKSYITSSNLIQKILLSWLYQ